MTALFVATIVGLAAMRRGTRQPETVAAVVWGALVYPLPTAAVLVSAAAVRRWRRATAVSLRSRDADSDTVLLADLVALGVSSGKTVRGALEAARPHLHPDLALEVDGLVAQMDRAGSAPALVRVGGRLADLGRVVASAVTSGAPVVAAITAHADRERHTRHAERITAARRLPVRLLLPLALLILPGFVVLAVGPALLQALARLAPIP